MASLELKDIEVIGPIQNYEIYVEGEDIIVEDLNIISIEKYISTH